MRFFDSGISCLACILCFDLVDKCALKRVSVLINLRSTTQLNTIGPWLKRPKLYTLCEKREREREEERERERRSIHINTKSAKNPRPKNNAKQTISHLNFPSLFFSRLFQSDDDKISHFETHQRNLKQKGTSFIWFFTILAGLAFYTSLQKRHTTTTQQMILCVSYIFWCLYP